MQQEGFLSLINAASQEATIDHKHMAGYEAGCIGGKVHSGADEFAQLAETTHGRAQQEFTAALSAIEECGVQRCAEHARRNRVDANTLRGPFDRQRFRQRNYRSFAGGIRGDFVEGYKRRERSNIDDSAIALFEHVTPEDSAGAQRASQVGFEDRVPVRFRKLECWRSLHASGGIHQDLDAAEFGANRMQECLDAAEIGDVTGSSKRAAAQRLDFRDSRAQLIGSSSRWDDVRASLSESAGKCKPDAACAANDNGCFVRKIQKSMTHPALPAEPAEAAIHNCKYKSSEWAQV